MSKEIEVSQKEIEETIEAGVSEVNAENVVRTGKKYDCSSTIVSLETVMKHRKNLKKEVN